MSATRVTEERRKELPDSKDVVKMREDCGVDTEKLADWHPDSRSRTGTSQNFRVIDNSELVEFEFLDFNHLFIKKFRVIDNSELVECECLDLNRLFIKILPSY